MKIIIKNNTASKPYHLLYGAPEKDGTQMIKQRFHSDNNCKYCVGFQDCNIYTDQPNDCKHKHRSLTQGVGYFVPYHKWGDDVCSYCLDKCTHGYILKTCGICSQ